MMLTYLGNGTLYYCSYQYGFHYFSHDYGRTWTERIPRKPAPDGLQFSQEGNMLVDRDKGGHVVRLGTTGETYPWGLSQASGTRQWLSWSYDGGRTWVDQVAPKEWNWPEERTYCGIKYRKWVGEGALVRAGNGWLVEALRQGSSPEWLAKYPDEEDFHSTVLSVSKDEGKTWLEPVRLFEGRMHPCLVRLENGNLVLNVIRRCDIWNGKFVSYRRGCDAVVSHDNGLTWDLDHMYILDDFAFCQGTNWPWGNCGHVGSIPLEDGHVLTAYGDYSTGGVLVRWKP